MRKRMIDALQDAIAAERLAAELRALHGRQAEDHCDSLIAACAADEGRREQLHDVRRALRWI